MSSASPATTTPAGLAPQLNAAANTTPVGTVESLATWGMLAWTRRQQRDDAVTSETSGTQAASTGHHFQHIRGSRIYISDLNDNAVRVGSLVPVQPNLFNDFTNDPDGSPTHADSGQPPLFPVEASGAYVINDTGTRPAAGYWTAQLTDAARITYAQAQFQMTVGTTAGQAAVVALWESPMPSGALGTATNRAPIHLVFIQNGYIVQSYDSANNPPASTIGVHVYATPPTTGVQ